MTLFSVCSTIQSKVVTTVRVKRTSTVWLKYLEISSTNVSLKVYLLLVNTVVY
ncbi:Uncharacterised protein [Mycobacterium tuberculosis]|nr:Uncharacterised protein [Mycobacterium tuberculosis]